MRTIQEAMKRLKEESNKNMQKGGTIYCTLDFLESYAKDQKIPMSREELREAFQDQWNEKVGMYILRPLS